MYQLWNHGYLGRPLLEDICLGTSQYRLREEYYPMLKRMWEKEQKIKTLNIAETERGLTHG
jgi:hypothetical protein